MTGNGLLSEKTANHMPLFKGGAKRLGTGFLGLFAGELNGQILKARNKVDAHRDMKEKKGRSASRALAAKGAGRRHTRNNMNHFSLWGLVRRIGQQDDPHGTLDRGKEGKGQGNRARGEPKWDLRGDKEVRQPQRRERGVGTRCRELAEEAVGE